MKHDFNDIMTTAEAGERWGIAQDTVKQLCTAAQGRPPRLIAGKEFRKSGRTWLVTRAGMERLYGEEKK